MGKTFADMTPAERHRAANRTYLAGLITYDEWLQMVAEID